MFNGDKSLSNLKNRATPVSIIQKLFDSPEEDVVVLFKTLYSNWSDGATTITKDQLSCNPGVTHPQHSSPFGYFAASVNIQHYNITYGQHTTHHSVCDMAERSDQN